eukprot:Rhum_TRINITY_DN8917_c0_g1::Rhum_TRINITY_DN8917_c0_g1_i1::g.30616::m.30616
MEEYNDLNDMVNAMSTSGDWSQQPSLRRTGSSIPSFQQTSDGGDDDAASWGKRQQTAANGYKYKTKLCKNWAMTKTCHYGSRCSFAHGNVEQRPAQEEYFGDRRVRRDGVGGESQGLQGPDPQVDAQAGLDPMIALLQMQMQQTPSQPPIWWVPAHTGTTSF